MTFAMLALTGTYVATFVAKKVGWQEFQEIFKKAACRLHTKPLKSIIIIHVGDGRSHRLLLTTFGQIHPVTFYEIDILGTLTKGVPTNFSTYKT